jgi:hypothetical protein
MIGWELAAEAKRRARQAAVFRLTARGEALAAGQLGRQVDRVLAKPVSADALLEPLATICSAT